MRHAVYALLCFALAAGIAVATDHETLQGNWKLALAVHDGRPLTGGDLEARLHIEGDRFSVQGAAWPMTSGTVHINESTSPRTIDLKAEDGTTALGIYEVRAGNRIRVCIAPAGAPRPARFESKAGSGLYHQEWIRVR